MNARYLFLVLYFVYVGPASAQLLRESISEYRKDFDGDSDLDWASFVLVVVFQDTSELPLYEVRNELRVSRQAAVLVATTNRIEFEPGEEITLQAKEYFSQVHQLPYLWLQVYQWDESDWLRRTFDEFPGQYEVIVGTKYTNPDTADVTLGWFRYRRENLDPGHAYRLQEMAYHPIPNQSIRAGLPPDLPEPNFAWNEEGLTVSWPDYAWMLRLEMTETLSPPEWKPVDTGGFTSVTLALEDQASVFFRLVALAP
ncbi:MAG TPA: hypothetical protein PLX89_00505 [Verrucomicrobiota bacterium]|nr:hypothetical protein [Verrucomicrobiales bacterium]HRI11457.1 hypothetical protein [Verrucomicrobiota bacterium]